MKNLSEALEKFKKEFVYESGAIDCYYEEMEPFLKSTLISLLDEVVPEEMLYMDKDAVHTTREVHSYNEQVIGYNRAVKELIERINEVKK